MAVQKTPRKRSAVAGSQPISDITGLPDRRAMEKFLANLDGQRVDEAIGAAQDIIYQAWEEPVGRERVRLAKEALCLSPLCADAYVLLADEAAASLEEALDLYQRGVEAGELALGPDGFDQYAGHFWGFLETRPYMRARAGLAASLWRLGRQKEATKHYKAMLVLNPNDNQGIRYVLAGHLLAQDDVKSLKQLLRQYEEDASAAWLYTQALLAFRENDPQAEELAAEAWNANSHVPAVLAGKKPPVASADGYITMGGEDEAAHMSRNTARDGGPCPARSSGWTMSPGSLNQRSDDLSPG